MVYCLLHCSEDRAAGCTATKYQSPGSSTLYLTFRYHLLCCVWLFSFHVTREKENRVDWAMICPYSEAASMFSYSIGYETHSYVSTDVIVFTLLDFELGLKLWRSTKCRSNGVYGCFAGSFVS
jgi:hypothetical protein